MTTTTTVVIPAHNEAERIQPVLDAVRDSPAVARIITVADTCSDGTADLAAGYGTVVHVHARDKGTAMAAGLAQVNTPHVLFIDADLAGLQPGHVTALCSLEPWDGQLVGIRDNRPLTAVAGNLPSLSGERRLPAYVARQANLAGSGWEAETRLNATVARLGLPWRHILLHGVTNPTKIARRPWGWVKEFGQIFGSATVYAPELAEYAARPGGRPTGM